MVMVVLQRHGLHQQILDYINHPKQILIIEGVRQTGKTTAIQEALKTHPYTLITLSDEDFATIQLRQAKTFAEFEKILQRNFNWNKKNKKILVIDEAQRSAHLYSFIMQMEREWKNIPLILSGSVMGAFFANPNKSNTVTPAGRVTKLVCRPFSFYEFLDWTGSKAILEAIMEFTMDQELADEFHEEALRLYFEYLSCGGYPRAIEKRDNLEALYEYFQTLISFFRQDADRYLTDIIGSPHYQYGALMQTVLESIARHTCDMTQRSTLLSTDSPAYRTILPALLDALEEWHFIFRLIPKMKALSTKQGTASKKYLWDVGFLNHFLNQSRPVSPASDKTLVSKLLESAVAQELIFSLKYKERLFSWKSHQKQSRELDFLAHFPHIDAGIEVKAADKINWHAISQLKELIKSNRHGKYYIVYLGKIKKEIFENQTITWIPPYLIGKIQ